METIARINEGLARTLLILAAVLAFLLCFLVVADVTGRVVFGSPVKGTTEIVSLAIVVICYLQAGYAVRSGGMLRVDMFVLLGGPRTQGVFAALCALGGLVFFGLVFFGSLDGAIHSWVGNEFEGEGALRVPVWPAKFALVAGTFLASVNYLLAFILHCWQIWRNETPEQFSISH